MTAADIISRFAASGLILRRDGDVIRCRGPAGALTHDLRALLAERRSGVLAALTTYPCTWCGRFAFSRPTTCFWCRMRGAL